MKKFLVIMLILGVTFSMFAQGAEEAVAASSQVELNVLHYMDMSDPNSANEVTFIWDRFEELNPDIKLVREDLFNEPFHQKTEAYVASGNLPDVMYMWPSGRSTSLHTTGSVQDLMPFLEKDGIVGDYIPAALAPQTAGILGELPNTITSSHMLYVNTAVLREIGAEMPKTYEEMKALMPALEAKGKGLIAMDNMDSWVMQSCLFSTITGRFGGANWYEKLAAGEIDFEDEWFINALNIVEDMYATGMINRNSLASPYGSSKGAFVDNQYAFYIDGDWATGSFQTDITTGVGLLSPERQATDIELAVLPALPGEVLSSSTSGVVGTGYGMSANIEKGSAKEAAAWKLIKFLESPEAQEYRLKSGGMPPSNVKVDVDKVIEENNLEPLVGKRMAFYSEAYDTISPVIDGVLHSDVFNVINVGLQEIGLGDKTPAQVAADVQDAWEAFNK